MKRCIKSAYTSVQIDSDAVVDAAAKIYQRDPEFWDSHVLWLKSYVGDKRFRTAMYGPNSMAYSAKNDTCFISCRTIGCNGNPSDTITYDFKINPAYLNSDIEAAELTLKEEILNYCNRR